jgi:predicted nucleotidyltransferase component of viral defense system
MRHRNTRRSHSQSSASAEDNFRSHKFRKNASATVDFSRIYMKQVVAIHQAMFEKLLFDEDAAASLDLADLFHDAGTTYLKIAERINETCLSQQSLQD